MKEATYEDWQKNLKQRVMWVWDDDEEEKEKQRDFLLEKLNNKYVRHLRSKL